MERSCLKGNGMLFIFGFSWPEVNAVFELYRASKRYWKTTPYFGNELPSLIESLNSFKSAQVILILSPRDHASLLYSLTIRFPDIQIMIIGDRFYYSDRVVLELLGVSSWETIDVVFSEYVQSKLLFFPSDIRHPSLIKREFKNINPTDRTLVNYINNYMAMNLDCYQLTPTEQVVILWLSRGISLSDIGRMMGLNAKSVSSHKIKALKKLPSGDDRKALSRSLRIRSEIVYI